MAKYENLCPVTGWPWLAASANGANHQRGGNVNENESRESIDNNGSSNENSGEIVKIEISAANNGQ
jgi:hypothetical protein